MRSPVRARHSTSVAGSAAVCQAWNYPNFGPRQRPKGLATVVTCTRLSMRDLPKGGNRLEQRLGSTCLSDGTKVAYATAGDGPLLLFIGGWLSHLELSWALPAERHLFEGFARGRTVLRYDRPGCGLSDRPGHVGASLESELDNVAAVIAAAGVDRCEVMGSSLGAPVAIEWAARHPDTVDRLVLYGGWARGPDLAPAPVREHVVGLVNSHWGLGADVLTDIFAPEASTGTRSALAAYQRQASSAATAADLLALCYRIDVTGSLAKVRAPTLVVQREHDRAAPADQARLIAAGIPASRLRILPGRSHMPYIGDVDALIAVIRDFLGLPALRRTAAPRLTTRQGQVAALVTQGLTNREIGKRLGIDERSAEGHIERIRIRLGVRSRAQIAAWWVATNT
jgi:pimeloyl-ACP methyl ester carboxylesterase/DNA-binding CsgD family transcriptional regulator